DRLVAGEPARARDVVERAPRPLDGVPERLGAAFLGGHDVIVVRAHQIAVEVAQAVHDRPEPVRVAKAEEPRLDERQYLRETGAALDEGGRGVALAPEPRDLWSVEAEQKEVVGADLIANLDVGAVERADRE